MKRFFPLFGLIVLFLLVKLPHLGMVRLSDSNIYWVTGVQLLQGKILYKDIFFTNFPLLPYAASLYSLFLGGKLSLYYLTPLVEVIATGSLIYLLVLQKTQRLILALTSTSLYLFSFIILSTTDHQTGVFLASFFAVLSYFLYEKKLFLWAGASLALALLTKAYFLPILLVYLVVLFRDNRKALVAFLGGLAGTSFLVLLPTLLLAPTDLLKDVFLYSLTRTQGVTKSTLAWFFIQHDFVFVVLLGFLLFSLRHLKFLSLVAVFSLLFFLLYQDIYYLYLNFCIPFLCLAYPQLHAYILEKFSLQEMVVPTLLSLFLIFNVIVYTQVYADIQALPNLSDMTASVQKAHPPVLYGVNDLTPALSYLTNTPLLNNIIDTNTNLFRKGILDSTKLTDQAINQHALIITHGVSYPEANIQEDVIDEIFVREKLEKSCKVLERFPVKAEGAINQITFWQCV